MFSVHAVIVFLKFESYSFYFVPIFKTTLVIFIFIYSHMHFYEFSTQLYDFYFIFVILVILFDFCYEYKQFYQASNLQYELNSFCLEYQFSDDLLTLSNQDIQQLYAYNMDFIFLLFFIDSNKIEGIIISKIIINLIYGCFNISIYKLVLKYYKISKQINLNFSKDIFLLTHFLQAQKFM